MDPEKKSSNFIFPTKYVIPKSLKFSHWPSKKKSVSLHSAKRFLSTIKNTPAALNHKKMRYNVHGDSITHPQNHLIGLGTCSVTLAWLINYIYRASGHLLIISSKRIVTLMSSNISIWGTWIKNPHQDWYQSLSIHKVIVKNWTAKLTVRPLKIDHWKRRILLKTTIFRGYVSFRECAEYLAQLVLPSITPA